MSKEIEKVKATKAIATTIGIGAIATTGIYIISKIGARRKAREKKKEEKEEKREERREETRQRAREITQQIRQTRPARVAAVQKVFKAVGTTAKRTVAAGVTKAKAITGKVIGVAEKAKLALLEKQKTNYEAILKNPRMFRMHSLYRTRLSKVNAELAKLKV